MDIRSKVAVISCNSYEPEQVARAVAAGFFCLYGENPARLPERLAANPEQKILLKPNLLKKAEPKLAVTTHPVVFAAVAQYLQQAGCKNLTYGDSPGIQSFAEVARVSGIMDAAETLNIPPGNFDDSIKYEYKDGRSANEFAICSGVAEADCLIGISKMKTHALERITGAVKNMYGCIQGTHKSAGHVRYPSAAQFAAMLCDLHGAVNPCLHIMDGIIAMEGNGPASGTPVSMGVLLFSEDPVALDGVFCRLIHLDPKLVPTNVSGQQYGLGTFEESRICLMTTDGAGSDGDTAGQPYEISFDEADARWGNASFDVDRDPGSEKKFWKTLRFVTKPFQPRPVIRPDLCVHCGVCAESCPVEGKALSFRDGRDNPPVYDYSRCIRCFCCQEMCPKKAIEVKKPLQKNKTSLK